MNAHNEHISRLLLELSRAKGHPAETSRIAGELYKRIPAEKIEWASGHIGRLIESGNQHLAQLLLPVFMQLNERELAWMEELHRSLTPPPHEARHEKSNWAGSATFQHVPPHY